MFQHESCVVVEELSCGRWAVRLDRQMTHAEAKRLIYYNLRREVEFEVATEGGISVVSFSEEPVAREFARLIAR